MTEYSAAKTGECPRIFPNFQNCASCEKDLKDNKHDGLYLGRKQISEHIFAPNEGYCLAIHLHFGEKLFIIYIIGYTTQVNSTFRAWWLASSEVISQVQFTSQQPKKNKMAFVGILSQIKLLFGRLVIQVVWYILKQLFTPVSVKVTDIYLQLGE